jgi:KDO2-lipid IV(A) lauroyltransferase
MLTQAVLGLVRLLAWLPLPLLRSLGRMLGWLLYAAVGSRRRVVLINLRLCFPQWSDQVVRATAVQVFVCFAQSWLDRGWLWAGPPGRTQERLKVTGAVHELLGDDPTVLFAPHFMGLDAGWTALTQQIPRRFSTIYTDQANPISDAWIMAGRRRFGTSHLFGRVDGVKEIVRGLKEGEMLYLLPDMNFGPEDSVFVPFYGVPAATVPSLARFAKLGRAKVVPVISRMTDRGYEIEILPAWKNFPSANLLSDAALMNVRLQEYIDSMPSQYFWVHKRFKDRPDGASPPY